MILLNLKSSWQFILKISQKTFLPTIEGTTKQILLRNTCMKEKYLSKIIMMYIMVNFMKTFIRPTLTSHVILYYLCLADLSKIFSQLTLSMFIFFNTFFNRFCAEEKTFLNRLCQYLSFFSIFEKDFVRWKNLGLPYMAYIVIH